MADSFRCALVGWPEVEAWVEAIVHKMRQDAFRPEIVIGMSRGGIVPSRLLCDHLVIKNLFTVKTEHWGLTATPDGKARLSQALQADVRGKAVLIVDDITDTGQSLTVAREHVVALHPGTLRTSTLLHITHSLITPDYFAKKVEKDEWTWFIFPWNVREDLRNIVPKALDVPASLEELAAALKDRFKIQPEAGLLREIVDALVADRTVAKRGPKFVAATPKK
jgi:hypoxanthine phosphoribosyltransferase